ncbi:MAG: hypothetical protein JEZ03_04020 [Bacteroidales bacterium]|nr:hypothetical protein [Bacteroidales bacterium]
MNRPKDPLLHFHTQYGINQSLISDIIIGAKYCAVMLTNGNIGVCATLDTHITHDNYSLSEPRFLWLPDRIVLTAYFNALLNYEAEFDQNDIFSQIDFSSYKLIVMNGYFGTVVEKFRNAKIPLAIFDLFNTSDEVTPLKQQPEYLSKAEAIITTSTAIFNRTFMHLMKHANPAADIFMLGPSTPLSKQMFEMANIKFLFGTLYEKNDRRVLDLIQNGAGYKEYSHLGKKVFIQK